MRYVHTNLIAENWKTLSQFYQVVFGCEPQPPTRNLSGEWLERLTGIPGVHIVGEHLSFPGYDNNKPTLEIFSYEGADDEKASIKSLARPGFGHIAFEVESVEEVAALIEKHGGCPVGEVVKKDYPGLGTAIFVYMRDPEGNIIELQSWEG